MVPPSTYPLISETVLESLSEDLQELHEMLEWFEPVLCKFSVPLPVELFHYQEEKEFGITIHREDLIEFLKGDSLDISIVQTFLFCIKHKLDELGCDDVALLCPSMCSHKAYQIDKKGTMTYFKHALNVNFEKRMIFLPYNEGFHWILIVICPTVDKGFIFNSILSGSSFAIQKDLGIAYRVASTHYGRGKSIKWHDIKCARQLGSTECGYYVMRYMWEAIFYQGSIDIGKDWSPRSEAYTVEEFNNIRDIWARFFLDVVINM
ncbi:unnamed protein product [Cuscuta epithymum]|uniref:Ubiquitin-like protease family profile domain-containing protein n=1 Tax=Cuscuta epithymum TaxID=186058 RepID=A0AAV0CEG9_9ASTE|nr:unnamed protein product [Cuscuta epithymum]